MAYPVLGTGQSSAFLPFVIPVDPWKDILPKLTETEHRVIICNHGPSGVRAVVELLGGGLSISARVSRSGTFWLPELHAKIIVCDAKESKVRSEERVTIDVV